MIVDRGTPRRRHHADTALRGGPADITRGGGFLGFRPVWGSDATRDPEGRPPHNRASVAAAKVRLREATHHRCHRPAAVTNHGWGPVRFRQACAAATSLDAPGRTGPSPQARAAVPAGMARSPLPLGRGA